MSGTPVCIMFVHKSYNKKYIRNNTLKNMLTCALCIYIKQCWENFKEDFIFKWSKKWPFAIKYRHNRYSSKRYSKIHRNWWHAGWKKRVVYNYSIKCWYTCSFSEEFSGIFKECQRNSWAISRNSRRILFVKEFFGKLFFRLLPFGKNHNNISKQKKNWKRKRNSQKVYFAKSLNKL